MQNGSNKATDTVPCFELLTNDHVAPVPKEITWLSPYASPGKKHHLLGLFS